MDLLVGIEARAYKLNVQNSQVKHLHNFRYRAQVEENRKKEIGSIASIRLSIIEQETQPCVNSTVEDEKRS